MADWKSEDGTPRSLFFILISGVVAALSWLTNTAEEGETYRREGIAHRLEYVTAVSLDRLAQQRVVARQSRPHRIVLRRP